MKNPTVKESLTVPMEPAAVAGPNCAPVAGSAFRLSLVIEYPNEAAAPRIGKQECLGGTIVALQFSDALAEIELLNAANSDMRRIANERETFRQSLCDVLPIIEAMRYTAGLGKNQAARYEKAKAILAAYDEGCLPNNRDVGRAESAAPTANQP